MTVEAKAARTFFAAQVKDIEAATRAVIKASAREFRQHIKRQVRANFKKGTYSNGSFFKAFKIYDLDADATRGPASYVRAGVPFLHVFQTGKVITTRRAQNLIVLTEQGEKIGFKRISKGNPWRKVVSLYGKKLQRITLGADKALIIYNHEGRKTPVYYITKSVRVGKRIDFFAPAEAIANDIPDEINKLLN